MGSRSNTITQVADKRLVTGEGSAGITGDSNSLGFYNVETDQGAIASAADVVKSALSTVEKSDAVASEGFSKVLDLAGNLFDKNLSAAKETQASVASAYQDAKGGFDQKTVVMLAIAAVIGLYFLNRRARA